MYVGYRDCFEFSILFMQSMTKMQPTAVHLKDPEDCPEAMN